MKTNHKYLMEQLLSKHNVIASLIQERTVHYVDIPMHGNIGDLLIMEGTLAFLRDLAIEPKVIAAYFNFRPAWVEEGDVVLFHGGGNFGDLYPGPQQLRERVIASNPDNRVIILPQTIYFKSAQSYAECCRKFAQHKDLHICVRDQRSYELATPMSKNVYLLPDMAHQLWSLQPNPGVIPSGHLGILRTDDETSRVPLSEDVDHTTDWPLIVGKRENITINIHRSLRALHLAHIDKHIVTPASRLWLKRAHLFVREAIDLYSRYEYITTDRLHGHILACLMSIPHTLVDNSYGKNSTYAEQWTGVSDIVKIASTRERSAVSA